MRISGNSRSAGAPGYVVRQSVPAVHACEGAPGIATRPARAAILLAGCMLLSSLVTSGQVITIFEVKDPGARRLQYRYLDQLNAIGAELQSHSFPYPFYFSRQLDISEKQQQRSDQRSIRFDKWNGKTVLEITGNYYVAYADPPMDKLARVRKTYDDVVLPILKAAVPRFPPDDAFASFAVEVSYHVRRKVMGIETENAENVTFVVPREAAHHLVNATSDEQQQAALLDSEVYVDAEAFLFWLIGDQPPAMANNKISQPKPVEVAALTAPPTADPSAPEPSVSQALIKGGSLPIRLIAPDTLASLKSAHASTIARMTSTLDAQAHFVPYAPPAFIAFHQGAYLQLSLTTPLTTTAGSRYQLAALAFDEHIAHLVRPVLAYFPQDGGFDGISFSTTLKSPAGTGNSEAVEFFFPFKAARCFASYDCTGQQLIDSGIVLINGERAALNLEMAEAMK